MMISRLKIINLLIILTLLFSQLFFLSESVVKANNQLIVKQIKRHHLNNIISTYTTYFNRSQSNRVCNIKLAAQKLNGTVVMPKEVFSFNKIVGARLKGRGYKKATEIINGERVKGVGGGVCQVSSTLYNTVLLANLKIVERRHHSQPVGYIPLGRGATVYYGQIDFKFKNNTESPVVILAKIINNQLTISLLGRDSGEQVEIITSNPEIIKKKVIVKTDNSLSVGDKRIVCQGRDGIKVKVQRIVKRGDKIIKKEDVSYNFYPSSPTIVKVNRRN